MDKEVGEQIKYYQYFFRKKFRNILPKKKMLSLIYKVTIIKVTSSTEYNTSQFSGDIYIKTKANSE